MMPSDGEEERERVIDPPPTFCQPWPLSDVLCHRGRARGQRGGCWSKCRRLREQSTSTTARRHSALLFSHSKKLEVDACSVPSVRSAAMSKKNSKAKNKKKHQGLLAQEAKEGERLAKKKEKVSSPRSRRTTASPGCARHSSPAARLLPGRLLARWAVCTPALPPFRRESPWASRRRWASTSGARFSS